MFYWDDAFGDILKNKNEAGDIEVLSYNVRVFNNYNHLHANKKQCKDFISWVLHDSADIKCLQEFYSREGSSVFNTIEQVRAQDSLDMYFSPSLSQGKEKFGMAILSRYPIVNKGKVVFNEKYNNQVIFADVKLPRQDTIRIINMHLASMSMGPPELYNKGWYNNISLRLMEGWKMRTRQVSDLVYHIKRCPYPVILCGDLNDLPFSYAYQKLNTTLYNAFEQGGSGMGFTFNGKLFFLRIDNQFFSEQFSLTSFKTMQDVSYSDHYPLKGIYHLNR